MKELIPINAIIGLDKTVHIESECKLCSCDLSGKVFERFYNDTKTNPKNVWKAGILQDLCLPCEDMKKRNKWIEKEIERITIDTKISQDEKNRQIAELESRKDKRVVTREHVIFILELHGFETVKKRFRDYEYTPYINDYIKQNRNHREWLERKGLGEYATKLEEKEFEQVQYAGIY